MKPGDLIEVLQNVTGGGKVRRVVWLGEIGMLIDTHYNSDLTISNRLWLNVMMSDGPIWLPSWSAKRME